MRSRHSSARIDQDLRLACCLLSSKLMDPLMRRSEAVVDMFGGKSRYQFFANGRFEPSARC
jgi:hypothetical protein